MTKILTMWSRTSFKLKDTRSTIVQIVTQLSKSNSFNIKDVSNLLLRTDNTEDNISL
jgi:hypothetical protein